MNLHPFKALNSTNICGGEILITENLRKFSYILVQTFTLEQLIF